MYFIMYCMLWTIYDMLVSNGIYYATLYSLNIWYDISYYPFIYTAKAIEKFDTGGKGFLTYDEFQGLIASFKLKFTPVQMSEVE